MPYYVHPKDSPIDHGIVFETRQAAHEYQTTVQRPDVKYTITFEPTIGENRSWWLREHQRFVARTYIDVPWVGYTGCWEPTDNPDPSKVPYAYPKLIYHFAHLSITSPGCIAYTPTAEHGYQDRQVVVKVGVYAERYLKDYFTEEQIAEFVAAVKATAADLQVARTPDDIVAVYLGGPRSCMSHVGPERETCEHTDCGGNRRCTSIESDQHPVRVYGDSDLAVAYLGTMTKATARAVIWPDKQRYSRVYGDSTLKAVLEVHGYTAGSMHGARVRRLTDRAHNAVIMPYVDGCSEAEIDSADGRYVVLGSGDLGTDNTNGFAKIDIGECEHCGGECDPDNTYCDDCERERYRCQWCGGGDTWDLSDLIEVDGRVYYCESCAERYRNVCDVCSETWYEHNPYSCLCENCRDCYDYCSECDSWFSTDTHTECPDCHDDDDDEDTEDERPEDERPEGGDDENTPQPVEPPAVDMSTVLIRINDKKIPVPILVDLDPIFVIHETYKAIGILERYTLTHRPTGLIVCLRNSLDVLKAIHAQIKDLPNWETVTEHTTHEEIRHRVPEILRAHPDEVSA